MKKAFLIALLCISSFCAGAMYVSKHEKGNREFEESRHLASIARLRQNIYGPNLFHWKSELSEANRKLSKFDASISKGFMTLSYRGGLGASNISLRVSGDGSIYVLEPGQENRLVCPPNPQRGADFFKRVLKSGILNYSDAVIDLKVDLLTPLRHASVSDSPQTIFDIVIPELDVDCHFAVYAPEVKSQNYPDIIEYKLALEIEKTILQLVPPDDPFWN